MFNKIAQVCHQCITLSIKACSALHCPAVDIFSTADEKKGFFCDTLILKLYSTSKQIERNRNEWLGYLLFKFLATKLLEPDKLETKYWGKQNSGSTVTSMPWSSCSNPQYQLGLGNMGITKL